MDCLYCGKEIGPIRLRRDNEFCCSAHRTLYGRVPHKHPAPSAETLPLPAAMAGPAANLALVLAAAFLIRLGIAVGFFETPDSVGFTHVVGAAHEGIPYLASVLLSLMFSLNLLLCVFNLLPVPPLDGSSLPLLFISEDAAVRYWEFMRSPAVRMVGLVVAWNVFGQLFHPLHLHAINLLYTGLGLHYGP